MHLFRLAAFAILVSSPAFAQDFATGEQIREAVSGNTVQGSMTESGAYTEFYDADATIKGADYAGEWNITADTMCFIYGEDPATCWQVRIAGDQLTWVQDGTDLGTGTIIRGNVNNY